MIFINKIRFKNFWSVASPVFKIFIPNDHFRVTWYRFILKTNFRNFVFLDIESTLEQTFGENGVIIKNAQISKFCSLMTCLKWKDFKKGMSFFHIPTIYLNRFRMPFAEKNPFYFCSISDRLSLTSVILFFDNLTRIIILKIYGENQNTEQNTFRTELKQNKNTFSKISIRTEHIFV